ARLLRPRVAVRLRLTGALAAWRADRRRRRFMSQRTASLHDPDCDLRVRYAAAAMRRACRRRAFRVAREALRQILTADAPRISHVLMRKSLHLWLYGYSPLRVSVLRFAMPHGGAFLLDHPAH